MRSIAWTYARDLLKKGFDFSINETYTFDRKHADWPKDQAELDELWRKRTMNDWLRLKLAGKDDAEIRKTLDKRYAGYIERVKQLDNEDAFQTFMTAYAETTDPHTDYLGPRAAENFDIAMKLSLEGIGAVLQARDDYTTDPRARAGRSGSEVRQDQGRRPHRGHWARAETARMIDVIGWRLDDVVNRSAARRTPPCAWKSCRPMPVWMASTNIVTLVREKVSIEEQAAKKKVIDHQGRRRHPQDRRDRPAHVLLGLRRTQRRRQGLQERHPRRGQADRRTQGRKACRASSWICATTAAARWPKPIQ